MWAGPPVLQFLTALALASWLAIAALPSGVRAQSPQQNALARTLFEDGVVLADKGDWVGAADRFSRAYSLKPTSGVAFNWASALLESGRLLHAQELLLGILRDPAADSQLKLESEKRLAALTPRIAKLHVHVAGEPDEHVSLELDGLSFPRAAWDMASPVDPGAHSLVLKQGQSEAARADVTLREGEQRTVSLALPVAEPIAAKPAPTAMAAPTRQERRPLYKSWMVWTGVGVVLVGAVVTGIVLAKPGHEGEASPVTGNATPGVLRW
jgi:hypothetical protein